MAKNNNLSDFLTDIANSIRAKKGTTGTIKAQDFSTEISSIETGGSDSLQARLNQTKSAAYLFYGFTGNNVDYLVNNDFSNVTNMNSMFSVCSYITTIPLLDTSNVTNMSFMFSGCSKLTTIPLLDTSKVTAMGSMFENCYELTSIPQLNTSSVTNMSSMFESCANLTTIPQLNTSNVTHTISMFENCSNLTTIPLLDTSKVTDMHNMFYYCSNLTTITLLDTSKVTNMGNTFYGCRSLTKVVIKNTVKVPPLSSNSFNICYHFYGIVNAAYNPNGLKDGRIYVPDDKVEEFKTATNWSVFADIIVPLSTLVE